MSIQQLPSHIADKLKSSAAITSLEDAAIGLLKNSLDGQATRINIHLDWVKGGCTVEDDGAGIPPFEFFPEGGLVKSHHTSRLPVDTQTHGKGGNFLAALSHLCLLRIVSGHVNHVTRNSLSIHHGEVLLRQTPCPPAEQLNNFDHGTRVSVCDLFGAMPVRVKQRSLLAESSGHIQRRWLSFIRSTLAYVLAWPTDVLVVLRDTRHSRQCRLRSKSLDEPIQRIAALLHQVGFSSRADSSAWTPVAASCGGVKVKGCIGVHAAPTKRYQFINLGIQPLGHNVDTNALYDQVNKIFEDSLFGVPVDSLNGGRKSGERWPAFCISIQISKASQTSTGDDDLGVTEGVMASILDLLKAVCYGFLKKHSKHPRKIQMFSKESLSDEIVGKVSGKTLVKSKSAFTDAGHLFVDPVNGPSSNKGLAHSAFDGWPRIKRSQAALTPITARPGKAVVEPRPLIGQDGKVLRKPFEDVDDEVGGSTVLASSANVHSDSDVVGVTHKLPRPWLQEVIRNFGNPVFATATPPIRRTLSEPQRTLFDTPRACLEAGSVEFQGKLSKGALAKAQVISQVDKKFILVKMPLLIPEGLSLSTSSTLVMLDQHACDERCKLEELMAAYFTTNEGTGDVEPVMEVLDKPLLLDLSIKDHRSLHRTREHFAAWGIVWNMQGLGTADDELSSLRIRITSLPPSIAERCRLEPSLLVDMLLRESTRLQEGGTLPSPQVDKSGSGAWFTHFRGCPQGVLDLLHSRSCRSAIMFNDVLSHEDCEDLVRRLAKCVLPFQCAHGRPSMAALLDLGSAPGFGQWNEDLTRATYDGAESKWQDWLQA